jgi:leucyl-tRNA synthetase
MTMYDPKKIEAKWQKHWEKNKTFSVKEDSKKKKFYSLIEFPYPSGEGLHVGHPRPFTAMDVISRKRRMEGFNVLYPIGFDAFGLPTENHAIKTKQQPAVVTKKNIANFTRQLKSLGYSFDWDRVVDTTNPKYFKWTQWLFLQFFRHGLAYKKNQPINWCPKDKIGLANEEVVNGCCERCGTAVEQRNKEQWMLAITKYAEKLLDGLKEVDYITPARVQQENWIGKSEGAEIDFLVVGQSVEKPITVFTTRPDTLFGVTFLAVSVEVVKQWVAAGWKAPEAVQTYCTKTLAARAANTTREEVEKTGIATGFMATNPANGELVPVWVTNYVLGNVGTGAVMGVPAHDERDFEFAKEYNLPIRIVVEPVTGEKKDNEKFRKSIVALVRNPKNNTYLSINWGSKLGGNLFVGGGLNDGEDAVQCAVREIKEETGYKHVRLVAQSEKIHHHYFAFSKNEAREIEAIGLYFELENEERVEQKLEENEKNKFTVEWLTEENAAVRVVDPLHAYVFNKFVKGKCFTSEGVSSNSGFLDGLQTVEAKEKIISWLEEKKFGKRQVNYKLRDWVFSRQRYWGEPIPLVYCEVCAQRKDFQSKGEEMNPGWIPVEEKTLPLELPKVDKYEPTDSGESPLAPMYDWVETTCPRCEKRALDTKYLIFDFDGVIGDTLEACVRSHIVMGAKDKKEALESIHNYLDKKPDYTKNHKLTKEQVAEEIEWMEEYGKHMSKESYELFEEFINEVKEIPNTKIAIVSTGSKLYVEDGVKRSKLKATHILSFEDHHSKEEKIERICKAWGVPVEQVYYFTDTKADVFELENLLDRKKIIGCAWGYHGLEKLREVLPDHQILKKFDEIHNLFAVDKARRETDTMPNWAGSSWYFLRYTDPKNDKEFASVDKMKYWMNVDWYNGGMEHTVLHLLYSRFWNLFMYDIGLVPNKEPYQKRTSHGMILGPDGEKMSKSRGNVINPDEMQEKFSTDALRAYIMFMGPFDQAVMWDTNGLVGVRRFLDRTWSLQEKVAKTYKDSDRITSLLHQTIKKVSSDIDEMRFNTAIAKMMELVNDLMKEEKISEQLFVTLLKLLSPFAPHFAEELSSIIGIKEELAYSEWPTFDAKLTIAQTFTLAVQINGKVRDTLEVVTDITEEKIKELVLQSEKVQKWLEGKAPKKIIYVKGKLVSVVV